MRRSYLLAFMLINYADLGAAASTLNIEGGAFGREEKRVNDIEITRGMLVLHFDGQRVTVSPWPEALPRQLGTQYITVDRVAHPAGPVQSVSFRTPEDTSPWLTLVANGPFGRQLAAGFRLLRNRDGGISVSGRDAHIPAALGVPVVFHDSTGKCWQFVLLSTYIPRPREGIADEKEPRADWYLRGDQQC